MPAATTSSARSSSATTRAWCASSSSPCPASSPASPAGSMPSPTRSSRSTRWRGAMSANALLMTYIGGVGAFAGRCWAPILIVLLQSWVSLLSNAWLVYVGVLFILMVTFAPGGIAGLVLMHEPIARSGPAGPARRALCADAGARPLRGGGLRPAGRAVLVPHHRRRPGQDTSSSAASPIDPKSAMPWVVGALLPGGGGLWLRREGRRVARGVGRGDRGDQGGGGAGMSETRRSGSA